MSLSENRPPPRWRQDAAIVVRRQLRALARRAYSRLVESSSLVGDGEDRWPLSREGLGIPAATVLGPSLDLGRGLDSASWICSSSAPFKRRFRVLDGPLIGERGGGDLPPLDGIPLAIELAASRMAR